MKKLIIAASAALALTGCAGLGKIISSALTLTPDQQANLDRYIAAGNIAVKTTAGVYCVMEPLTTQIVRIFDPSNGTATGTTKVDQATNLACQAALKAALIVAQPVN